MYRSSSAEASRRVIATAAAISIDPTSTEQSATLTSTEIFYIPVPSSHDLQQSLVALPQVLRDAKDLLHLAGARSTESQFLMDGFEVGSPVDNSLTMRLIVGIYCSRFLYATKLACSSGNFRTR